MGMDSAQLSTLSPHRLGQPDGGTTKALLNRCQNDRRAVVFASLSSAM